MSTHFGPGGGINTYAYVAGNPLKYADPKGLEKIILVPLREGWTYAAALLFPDRDEILTIVSHGSQLTVNFKTPSQLADLIRKLPSWAAGDKRPILLNACNTGAGGEDSYAAKLSKELGVSVIAPTTQTWNIGPFDIGPFNETKSGGAPYIWRPGQWVRF